MGELHRLADEACRDLPVGLHRRQDICWELLHHLQDVVRGFQESGLTYDEAVGQAALHFGDPSEVRAQFMRELQGGPKAMWRRVIVPGLLIMGGSAALAILGWYISAFNRWWVDGSIQGRHGIWPGPIPLGLGWLEIPLVFAGCYLCGARGGTKRECVIVGFSPLALLVPATIYFVVTLGFGSVSAGTMTIGVALVRSALVSTLLEWVGKCAAGTVLYLIAFHRIEMARRAAASEPGPTAE